MKIPSNIESEATTIGKMLNDPKAASEALDYLDPFDFYDTTHNKIFQAMKDLSSIGSEITPLTVCESMNGDITLLCGLTRYGQGDDIQHFISILKRLGMQRKILYTLHGVIPLAENDKIPPEEIQTKISKDLDLIFSEAPSEEVHISQVLRENFRDTGKSMIEFIKAQKEKFDRGDYSYQGISTGYPRLDEAIDGLCDGHLIIVAARPGNGKTTLILNLIKNMTEKMIPIGFFSLEMGRDDVCYGLACLDAKIASKEARKGNITSYQLDVLEKSTKKLENYPIWVQDQSRLRISQLCTRVKRMIATHNVKAVFIDYLGEVCAEGKFANRQEQVQDVSKAIRCLAKEMKIPIILICQLNREAERENRVPKKSDLRESGQIEADAHSVILLHRPKDDSDGSASPLQLHIVKNRFGEEKRIDFIFQKKTGQILECDSNSTEPKISNLEF